MNDVIGLDLDVDWVEGAEEPGNLLWTDNGWSLVDSLVATAVDRYGFVSGLDSQGCSILPSAFERKQAFYTGELCPVALLAKHASAIRRVEIKAAAA